MNQGGADAVLLAVAVFLGFVLANAVVLSLAQAWALSAIASSAPRRVLAWAISTIAMVLPLFVVSRFPSRMNDAHVNVPWSALILSALTAAATMAIARALRPAAAAEGLPLLDRARRLFPVHVALLILFVAADIVILLFVSLSNIH